MTYYYKGDLVETLEQQLDHFLEETILKGSEKNADSFKLSVDPFEHFAPTQVDPVIRTGINSIQNSHFFKMGLKFL